MKEILKRQKQEDFQENRINPIELNIELNLEKF